MQSETKQKLISFISSKENELTAKGIDPSRLPAPQAGVAEDLDKPLRESFYLLRFESPNLQLMETLFSDSTIEKRDKIYSITLRSLHTVYEGDQSGAVDCCRLYRLFWLDTGLADCGITEQSCGVESFCRWLQQGTGIVLSPEQFIFEKQSFEQFTQSSWEVYMPRDFEDNEDRTKIVWYAFDELIAEEEGLA